MKRRYAEWEFETNGIVTTVGEWGEGEQHAVLLHGVSGNRVYWSDLGPQLAQRGWHVWAPSLRGAGQESVAMDSELVGREIDTYVEDLVSWLDQAGIERAAIAGHSFGGRLAATFAASYPERVTKLILIAAAGPDALTDVAEKHPELVGERGPSYRSLTEISGPVLEVLQRLHDRNPSATITRASLLRWIENLSFDGEGNAQHHDVAETADAQMAIIRAEDQTSILADITAPTVVMRSVDESPMLRHTIPHYVDHLAEVEFVDDIPGGHGTPTDAPEAVLRAFGNPSTT